MTDPTRTAEAQLTAIFYVYGVLAKSDGLIAALMAWKTTHATAVRRAQRERDAEIAEEFSHELAESIRQAPILDEPDTRAAGR